MSNIKILEKYDDVDYLIPKTDYSLKFNNLKGGGNILIQIGYKSNILLKKTYSVIIFEKRGENLIQKKINGKKMTYVIDKNGKLISGIDTFSDLKKELKKYLKESLID